MKSHYKLDWKTRLLDILLSFYKPIEKMSLDELKNASKKSNSSWSQFICTGKKIPVDKVIQQNINGRHGDIPVRLYYPNQQKSLPLILFFHGGGWVYGNLDTYDRLCRRVARDAGAIVLAVDYRLAPFYKYPTALEDCYDAFLWTRQNAANLSANPDRIIVMGDSAGGNLAAAVCLIARDRSVSSIAQQVLIYPVVSGKLNLPSMEKNFDAPVVTNPRMQCCVDYYDAKKTDILEAYFSPLFAENLSNLPPALIITCEYDPLHDQAIMYAKRLQDAEISVKLLDYPKTIHGFMSFPAFCKEASTAFAEVAKYIEVTH